jgi:hypothetical protein
MFHKGSSAAQKFTLRIGFVFALSASLTGCAEIKHGLSMDHGVPWVRQHLSRIRCKVSELSFGASVVVPKSTPVQPLFKTDSGNEIRV